MVGRINSLLLPVLYAPQVKHASVNATFLPEGAYKLPSLACLICPEAKKGMDFLYLERKCDVEEKKGG